MITKIVFDMDNTIIDEFGSTVRPGMVDFIQNLQKLKCHLYLWTNSTRERAKSILYHHKLNQYFEKHIFREDYDPANTGKHKDIRELGAELLIDDDPNEIDFVHKLELKGYLIKPYRKNGSVDIQEYSNIMEMIKGNKSFLKSMFK
jgi:FMN phosphatase YigB (HAD superfamily)